MQQQQTLNDALVNRRQKLLNQLSNDSVRNNPEKLGKVARELREIAKRLEPID